MNSLSELDTTYILNPLLKELDMIYELDDDPSKWKKCISYEVVRCEI
jgi:hypothetical protein